MEGYIFTNDIKKILNEQSKFEILIIKNTLYVLLS